MSCQDELTVYKNALHYCSVCTNVSDCKRIEELTNLKNPTGIKSQWRISENKNFASGKPNPFPCENKPETHKHYLMAC